MEKLRKSASSAACSPDVRTHGRAVRYPFAPIDARIAFRFLTGWPRSSCRHVPAPASSSAPPGHVGADTSFHFGDSFTFVPQHLVALEGTDPKSLATLDRVASACASRMGELRGLYAGDIIVTLIPPKEIFFLADGMAPCDRWRDVFANAFRPHDVIVIDMAERFFRRRSFRSSSGSIRTSIAMVTNGSRESSAAIHRCPVSRRRFGLTHRPDAPTVDAPSWNCPKAPHEFNCAGSG